jgi:mannose-6-phosphate isomerase
MNRIVLSLLCVFAFARWRRMFGGAFWSVKRAGDLSAWVARRGRRLSRSPPPGKACAESAATTKVNAVMAQVLYGRGDSDERPWGRWEVLDTGDGFAVKRITVNPGGILSLQLHHHRSEHWTIVQGTAKVTRDDQTLELTKGQHVHIPARTPHRVANGGEEPMIFIEVQYGDKLDETDIVRLDDRYGRS